LSAPDLSFSSTSGRLTTAGFANAFEVAPHGQVGYRFNFGDVVYLTPSVVVGPTISIATDPDNEVSVFVMPVALIGVRF
jgi:hypothetical protein